MATEAQIRKIIIDPMRVAYAPPSDPHASPKDYASLVSQWIEALKDYEPHELQAAYEQFVIEWQWKGWCVPGYMRKLAHQARQELTPRLPNYHKPDQDERTPTERERMEGQMAQWRRWMAGEAPANTYPHSPDFDPGAQYDWIYDGSLGPAHRTQMIERIAGDDPRP